jgi:hypothetical protein
MASIWSYFKKIVNDTTTELIDSQLPQKTADVVTTFVTSVTEVVGDTLVWVKDVTKAEEPDA